MEKRRVREEECSLYRFLTSQSEKRKRVREREGAKKGEHTRITHGVLSYDYRRATRNPFSCFLQTEHAFTLAVTWNRLQIPVFLCILAGHYSANNCRCESKRFHCRRFALVVPPRPMQNCTLFNSLTRDKGVSRCSQSSGSMNAKDSKFRRRLLIIFETLNREWD